MIARVWETARSRIAASDPGATRLRLALTAVLGIAITVAVLTPVGLPLKVMLVGAIGAMMTALTVNDRTHGGQAVTLLLGYLAGTTSMTVSSLGNSLPPVDSIVFVLLIFVVVYAQRFGPRGIAVSSLTFFLFFFAMFLQARPPQLPGMLLALSVGVAANALVRFVLLRRRVDKELLRIRKAFRARLAAVVRAAANYLTAGGTERGEAALRRANNRLHESVLMIEDSAGDLVDERAAGLMRRRTIEVELAVQWLSITTQRTAAEGLAPDVRASLVASLHRFGSLIARGPRELPVISDTGEFSEMLVAGSQLGPRAEPGSELRRAIAELAVADSNAQRLAEREYSAENDLTETGEDNETTPLFTYDNRTRRAIQAVVGGGLAMLGGELVSNQRWYWAVLTVFVVFIGSSSTGATFVRGVRRLGGTLLGIFGGVLSTALVAGNTTATLMLILVCVFAMVYTSRISQAVMAFFITTMLGLLYSLLGTFSFGVLWIRVAETAVGAAAGLLAAFVIVPVRTRSALFDDVADVLDNLEEFLAGTTNLLTGEENVNVIELSRELDRSIQQVGRTIEPLTHPVNVSSRRDYGWYVLTTLESIGFRARHIAARAQPGLLVGDTRVTALTTRIRQNASVLTDLVNTHGDVGRRGLARDTGTPVGEEAGDVRQRSLLSSLDQLGAGVIALGDAFGVAVDSTAREEHRGERPDTESPPPHAPASEQPAPSEQQSQP